MSARRLLLPSLVLAALAVPAGAQAVPPPHDLVLAAPAISAPSASHVVSTPSGKRLVVAVPVDYGLRVPVTSIAMVRETMTLDVRLRLPSGRTVTATDRRSVMGTSSWTIAHHVFFSASQTRAIVRARRAGPVKLRLTAAFTAVLGEEQASVRPAVRTGALPALTAPRDVGGSADAGHARGSDPCGYYGLSDCVNASGSTWSATHFWADHTWTVSCPSGVLPHYGSVGLDVTMQTTSNRYSPTNFAGPNDSTIYVSVSDDNVHGHPYAYTPWLACTPNG